MIEDALIEQAKAFRILAEQLEKQRDDAEADLQAAQRELAEIKRGEYICRKCGLRKDAEHDDEVGF
jgi:hypothetical protein